MKMVTCMTQDNTHTMWFKASTRKLQNIGSISVDGSDKSVFTNTSNSLIDLSGGTSGALQ